MSATTATRWAAVKLVALLLGSVLLFRTDRVGVLAGALAIIAALAAVGRVRPAALWTALRPSLVVMGVLVLTQGLVAGWPDAAVVGLRLLALVAGAAVLSATTRPTDLMDVLQAACRPLRPLGVDPARVGLVLALAIRFLPLLGERLAELRDAQRARGLSRPRFSLIGPMLLSTLRLADDVADALDARGGPGPEPQA